MTAEERIELLRDQLQKVCDRTIHAGYDSTGQEMTKCRSALIDECQLLLYRVCPDDYAVAAPVAIARVGGGV